MSQSNSSSSKTTYYYKLFRVRRSDGRVTTVSMNPVLVAHACKRMGSLRLVGQAVRTAALSYEDGESKNCSHFVSEELRKALAAPAQVAAPAAETVAA